VGNLGGPWDDGSAAWKRLAAWQAGRRRGSNDSAGDDALNAMADIGTLRRLLDQAELAAVRTARRHRRSWAEIATQLGITRQSAWERWRELDDDVVTESPAEPQGLVSEMTADLMGELTALQGRAQKRRAKVVVPNVVGMSWDDARITLMRAGLIPTGADADTPELAALGWPNVTVVDQVPESGAKVPAGSPVRLWLERGGGSAGVREPRRPRPDPKGGYEWRDEPSDEAVG
jgi:hypothetical protein